jgi:RpiB/LacA/LacB family sugar-phosphate isomerase
VRVYVASDHAGFELKQIVAASLREQGHDVRDLSPGRPNPDDDYPDSADALGRALQSDPESRGVLICGSGVGACVAVNKVRGIRGAVCHDSYSAHQGVEHDEMNVLVLGARIIGLEVAKELARVFLEARFSGEPRHVRRLGKIKLMEERF